MIWVYFLIKSLLVKGGGVIKTLMVTENYQAAIEPGKQNRGNGSSFTYSFMCRSEPMALILTGEQPGWDEMIENRSPSNGAI